MRNDKLTITVFCVVFVCLASSAPASTIPESIKDHIRARVDGGWTVGVVMGVVDADGTEFFSYGKTVRDGNDAVDEHSVFEIGSITKAFTGILLAEAVRRGEVKLDDPVQTLLPKKVAVPQRGGKQITLRDLATHRSSLPRVPDNMELDLRDPYADYTSELLYAFLNGHKLARDIGSEYEYSNLGMGLLGHALARQQDKRYAKLVAKRIAKPLGMANTGVKLTRRMKKHLARGHQGDEGKPVDNWGFDCLAGCGALRSTATDMLVFLSANMGLTETPLGKAMRASHEKQIGTNAPTMSIALAWHIATAHDAELIWHNGGTGGYRSFCGFDAKRTKGVVVLTNSTHGIDDLGMHYLEPKYALVETPKGTTVSAKKLDDYVGYYKMPPGIIFHITKEKDQLFAQLTGQDRYPVYAESSDKFFFKVVEARILFHRDKSGAVDQLTLHQGGIDQVAERLPADYEPEKRKDVSVPTETLKRYVGRYELAPGMIFTVALTGDQLTVHITGQQTIPVYATSPTEFYYKVLDAQITFEVKENGEVTGLVLHQMGRDQRAKRLVQ